MKVIFFITNACSNFTPLRRETLIFIELFMLKELLQSKGIKQKWLAAKLGVSEVTLSNWVKGKSSPHKKHLEKLCDILNIPLQSLIQ